MMKYPVALLLGTCIATLNLCAAWEAQANLITSVSMNVTPDAGGLNRYEYLVTNEIDSTLGVFQFVLNIAPESELQSLVGPVDWQLVYTAGDSEVNWYSFSPDTDVLPGQVASFAFSSSLPPIAQQYLVAGIDEVIGELETNVGSTLGPGVPVPEPSTLVLWSLFGMIGGVVAWRKRRSH
ncbi:MAG: PEP-CTERM sorting domain-containing protein [Pirellulaceae bacterium]